VEREDTDNRVFEALFRQAIIDKHIEEVDTLYNDSEIYTFSPAFEIKMTKLLKRERFKDKTHSAFKNAKKVAACFFIGVAVLSGLLMLNTDVRGSVAGLITEWFEQYVTIDLTSSESGLAEFNMSIGYIPDGYHEYARHDLVDLLIIFYENEDGDILYIKYGPNIAIFLDSENRFVEERIINGQSVVVGTAYADEESNQVIGQIDGIAISVDGMLSVEELFKIYESINPVSP
jgi:hypothetical protein